MDGRVAGEIGKGLLVFLCAVKGDTDKDLDHIVKKVSQIRIFGDAQGKMNLSVLDIRGEVLVVSQFTLAASTRKGNRPSFDEAEEPGRAKETYEPKNSDRNRIALRHEDKQQFFSADVLAVSCRSTLMRRRMHVHCSK